VINETCGNKDLERILGEGAYAEWFKLAHQADPGRSCS